MTSSASASSALVGAMARATHAARDDDDDAGTRRGDATRRARVTRAARVAAVVVVITIEVAAGHRARAILAAYAPRDVDDASREVDARAAHRVADVVVASDVDMATIETLACADRMDDEKCVWPIPCAGFARARREVDVAGWRARRDSVEGCVARRR